VCHDVTNGNPEGGRRAMENCLQRDPNVNVVYTINEPAAAGAYEALKAFGREDDVLLVSIDGGCPGVANVAAGALGATAQQYPLAMAALGVEAIATFVRTGARPTSTAGLEFFDTGAALVTDEPVTGLASIDSAAALGKCWG
jgi:fructose transport system substrate-binding protein